MRFPPEIRENARWAELACRWEATARKIGNVHPGANFSDTTHADFLLGATAFGEVLHSSVSLFVGERVLHSVLRIQQCVGKNTHLGIVLLIVPMALSGSKESTRDATAWNLSQLTLDDAECVYRAIRLASPGGLGDAPEQDVRDTPTVTLLEAMKLAADRDMIARQYANGFADVFDFGVPAFLDAFAKFGSVEAAIVDSQLRWMATFPDSLIARKNGPAVAEDVRRRAAAVLDLGGIATAEGRAAGVALDRHLRSDGNKLNPGTTADLIAACLFVALRENKIAPSAPFRWNAPDWL